MGEVLISYLLRGRYRQRAKNSTCDGGHSLRASEASKKMASPGPAPGIDFRRKADYQKGKGRRVLVTPAAPWASPRNRVPVFSPCENGNFSQGHPYFIRRRRIRATATPATTCAATSVRNCHIGATSFRGPAHVPNLPDIFPRRNAPPLPRLGPVPPRYPPDSCRIVARYRNPPPRRMTEDGGKKNSRPCFFFIRRSMRRRLPGLIHSLTW